MYIYIFNFFFLVYKIHIPDYRLENQMKIVLLVYTITFVTIIKNVLF